MSKLRFEALAGQPRFDLPLAENIGNMVKTSKKNSLLGWSGANVDDGVEEVGAALGTLETFRNQVHLGGQVCTTVNAT